MIADFGFRPSASVTDLLTIVSDRAARAYNMFGATRAVALDICKTLPRFGVLVFFKNLGQVFALFLSFLSNRQPPVVIDGKSSQEYPINAGVCQDTILCPTLFLLCINDLLDDVIWKYSCKYILHSTQVLFIWDKTSHLGKILFIPVTLHTCF